MTFRNPLIDHERTSPVIQTFDPAKRYRYTWPGQAPKVITGAELNELCKGADASMLAIEEASSDHPALDALDSLESGGHRAPFFGDRDPK